MHWMVCALIGNVYSLKLMKSSAVYVLHCTCLSSIWLFFMLFLFQPTYFETILYMLPVSHWLLYLGPSLFSIYLWGKATAQSKHKNIASLWIYLACHIITMGSKKIKRTWHDCWQNSIFFFFTISLVLFAKQSSTICFSAFAYIFSVWHNGKITLVLFFEDAKNV